MIKVQQAANTLHMLVEEIAKELAENTTIEHTPTGQEMKFTSGISGVTITNTLSYALIAIAEALVELDDYIRKSDEAFSQSLYTLEKHIEETDSTVDKILEHNKLLEQRIIWIESNIKKENNKK